MSINWNLRFVIMSGIKKEFEKDTFLEIKKKVEWTTKINEPVRIEKTK